MKRTAVVLLVLISFAATGQSTTKPNSKSHKAIQSTGAPKAAGPYSQGVEVRGSRMLFLAGQVGRDPKTGDLVAGDITAQTERVMENLKAVLTAAGLDFSHVVRCPVFLTDVGDFAKMNEVYGPYFTATPPARTTVQAAALPLKGALVEIDAIAVQ